jgi:putative phosphoribosyl transferase
VRGSVLRDRRDAGARLAGRLEPYRADEPLVLGLARGGVVVAAEVARRLDVPLEVVIVRKIGAPDCPEYGLGAIAEDGTRLIDEDRVRAGRYARGDLDVTIAAELVEIQRRAAAYREGRPPPELRGRTVVLVDDGVATGGTMHVACVSARHQGPRRLIVALGVAPPDAVESLRRAADDVVVCLQPEPFFAVGEWYRRFDQVEDAEVRELLRAGRARRPMGAAAARSIR